MKKIQIILFIIYIICAIDFIESASISSDEKIPVEVVYLKHLKEPEENEKPQGK